jgi:hypothetical protein
VISASKNQLQNLPADLFTYSWTSMDFSFNLLSSTPDFPFPVGAPRAAFEITGFPPVSYFDVRSNAGFSNMSRPTWVVGVPGQWSQKDNIVCPVLMAQNRPALRFFTDNGFGGWQDCHCASGYFGDASDTCAAIPSEVTVQPFALPAPTTGSTAAFWLLTGAKLDGNTLTLVADGSLQPVLDHSQTGEPAYPPSFTDGWYVKSFILQTGTGPLSFTTSWTIDLRTLRRCNATGQESYSNPADYSLLINATSVLQPVRAITLRLHISSSQFKPSDSLAIFDLKGNLVQAISGRNISEAGPSFTLTPSYQAAYNLSNVQDPVLITVTVAGNLARVELISSERTSARFVATYSYTYSCRPPSRLLAADLGNQCLVPAASQSLPGRDGTYTYECPALTDPLSPNHPLQVLTDPSAINYVGCSCSRGTFGHPPFCDNFPLQATISPFAAPKSELNASYFGLMVGEQTPSFSSIVVAEGLNASSSLIVPAPFSDAWYGDE